MVVFYSVQFSHVYSHNNKLCIWSITTCYIYTNVFENLNKVFLYNSFTQPPIINTYKLTF